MAVRGNRIDQFARYNDRLEMEDLRRQVQELQERLERYKGKSDSRRSSGSDNEENVNPFVVDSDEGTPNRHHVRGNHRMHSREEVKIVILVFEGKMDPDEFIDWLHTIERVFDLKAYPEDQKVKLVALKLKKYASLWWENLKRQRECEGRSKIKTWKKMKRELKLRFLPESYRQETFLKLHNFRQLTVSVEEYTAEFELLMLKKLALRVEKQQKDAQRPSFKSAQKNSSFNQGSSSSSKSVPSAKSTPKASSNSGSGKQPANSNFSFRKCFKCQGYGHIASECPNRKAFTVVKDDNVSEDELEYSEHEDEVIYADKGELLVIRRGLSAVQKDEDDDWLHYNIFHTRYSSHGKVCDLIIDSGACKNVVPTVMVDKLQLKTEPHPQPYKLKWLHNDFELKVSKRCLVSFSISNKYYDECWCDVIPMDSCHMLLGRSWQYDKRTQHDSYKNPYTFVKDGVKIVLEPSKLEVVPKPFKGEGIHLAVQEFIACLNAAHGSNVFDEFERDIAIPPSVQPLFDEYRDIVPEEIPASLPPIRDIQHCIDFVPEATIPNKPTYRMSPTEHEELQRQVDELLSKGLVRESKSPYSVPALLVPKKDGLWRMCINSRAVNKITVSYRFPLPRLDDLLD
ncbi:hypothetical protein SLA2020_041290 [Shorea laevis]